MATWCWVQGLWREPERQHPPCNGRYGSRDKWSWHDPTLAAHVEQKEILGKAAFFYDSQPARMQLGDQLRGLHYSLKEDFFEKGGCAKVNGNLVKHALVQENTTLSVPHSCEKIPVQLERPYVRLFEPSATDQARGSKRTNEKTKVSFSVSVMCKLSRQKTRRDSLPNPRFMRNCLWLTSTVPWLLSSALIPGYLWRASEPALLQICIISWIVASWNTCDRSWKFSDIVQLILCFDSQA